MGDNPSISEMYHFSVSYSGPGLEYNSIDVQDLAPALLGLGNLLIAVNNEFNGGKSRVRLLVNSDFEGRCFDISMDFVQTVFEIVKSFFDDERITTAKTLIEWVGICGSCLPVGLLSYWKIKNGRPIVKIEGGGDKGDVQAVFGDGNTIIIDRRIYNLGESPKAAKAALDAFPLNEGRIERIDMRGGDRDVAPVTMSVHDFVSIKKSCESVISGGKISNDPQVVTAHLRVYSPVFDANAEKWRFSYGDQRIYADISETSIAEDALARGGAFTYDIYKVRMSITEYLTPNGNFRNEYKILEVLEYDPAARTPDMFGPKVPD